MVGHSCTCAPLFHISETAGRIVLKFGMWLETHKLSVLQQLMLGIAHVQLYPEGTAERVHVRIPFAYLGKGWTVCNEIRCVARTSAYAFNTGCEIPHYRKWYCHTFKHICSLPLVHLPKGVLLVYRWVRCSSYAIVLFSFVVLMLKALTW